MPSHASNAPNDRAEAAKAGSRPVEEAQKTQILCMVGIQSGEYMGLTYVTVNVKPVGSSNGGYEAVFLVDTGATDSLASASKLIAAGIAPAGKTTYELADG